MLGKFPNIFLIVNETEKWNIVDNRYIYNGHFS